MEKVGLVEIDLLGLKTLTQIRYCVDFIKHNRGVDLDVNRLPLEDAETFALLSKGDTNGVFQFESSGMKDLLIRLQPTRVPEAWMTRRSPTPTGRSRRPRRAPARG